MTDDARSLIPEYVLGLLPEREAASLRAKIQASPELQRELTAVREALSVGVELAEVQPRKEARAKLLAAAAGPERRFAFVNDCGRSTTRPRGKRARCRASR
jgi:anti-sigma-K factor RskA